MDNDIRRNRYDDNNRNRNIKDAVNGINMAKDNMNNNNFGSSKIKVTIYDKFFEKGSLEDAYTYFLKHYQEMGTMRFDLPKDARPLAYTRIGTIYKVSGAYCCTVGRGNASAAVGVSKPEAEETPNQRDKAELRLYESMMNMISKSIKNNLYNMGIR